MGQEKVYENLFSFIVEFDEELGIPKEVFTSYIISAHIGVNSTWLEKDMKYSPAFMVALLTKLTLQGPMRIIGLENKIRLPK
ncbi:MULTISPECIES: TetR-like C-terminal domain-containing protein [Bacillus cereus group]|uniref:TetR-like C-terminal domain-containing protein n=1 Tax=Bacillus cereus group TaxID=86661 RepID=UPI002107ED6B|nr:MULTISPECIES: TetR-like C-terminal domain-containing protein [Bacillus cereus group]